MRFLNNPALIGLMLCAPWPALAQKVAILAYPTSGGAYGITNGPDGAIWFTEPAANHIGRITTAGVFTEFLVPTPQCFLQGITTGPDGALWFAEYYGEKIGRITTDGVITEYPITTPFSEPEGIAAGPDGALWFTQNCLYSCVDGGEGANIGRITTTGAITEFDATAAFQPWDITAGPDGALWFTDLNGDSIGRITTAGDITIFPVGTYNTAGITVGPDGALWYTQLNGNTIGRITTAGVITPYPIGAGQNGAPEGITAGPDGALWFADEAAKKIGRITTSGSVSLYPLPSKDSDPVGITRGPDGSLWYAADKGSQVGEVVLLSASVSATPQSGYYRSPITFSGSGFTSGESVNVYEKGVGSPILASAPADSTGAFTATATAPQSDFGPRAFLGVGQTSGKIGAAKFSMRAALGVQPAAGSAGASVTAALYGFGPNETVDVYWSAPHTLLGSAKTDLSGTIAAFEFTVPLSAKPGANKLYGQGQTTEAIGPGAFTVQ